MLMNVLSVLCFTAIGALIGFLFNYFLYTSSSLSISIILGIVGSLAFSWLGKLLGLGQGFFVFSVWGMLFAILGAALLVWIYGFISKRRNNRTTIA